MVSKYWIMISYISLLVCENHLFDLAKQSVRHVEIVNYMTLPFKQHWPATNNFALNLTLNRIFIAWGRTKANCKIARPM